MRVYGFSGVGDLGVCVNVIAMHKSFFIVENGYLRHWHTSGPTCYYMFITVRYSSKPKVILTSCVSFESLQTLVFFP